MQRFARPKEPEITADRACASQSIGRLSPKDPIPPI